MRGAGDRSPTGGMAKVPSGWGIFGDSQGKREGGVLRQGDNWRSGARRMDGLPTGLEGGCCGGIS